MNELLAILLIAVIVDRIFGEPPPILHSTVWMGKIIDFLKNNTIGNKRIYSLFVFLSVTLLFSCGTFLVIKMLTGIPQIILGSLILKMQFSWKAMRLHSIPIVELIEKGDIINAREKVAMIVGRKTKSLDEEHVLSATVESIGESCVDGIISPLFYYALFSPLGPAFAISAAVFYRSTNTLDSMIGYRNIEIGLIAAKMDDVLNYIPARLTAVMFIVSSFMIKMRWKNSIKVYFRDRNKTPSPNSGQAMSALAGALGVRLEKIGFYQIGERIETLKPHDVLKALNVVDVSVSLFVGLIAGVIQLVEYIG